MPIPRTERGEPHHFAGRCEELGELGTRLAAVKETGKAVDGLALITGVPGAGKTTLALRFAESRAESPDVFALVGGVSHLDDALNLFLIMGDAIGEKEAFEKLADVHSRRKSGSVGVGPVKAGLEYDLAGNPGGFAPLLQASAKAGLWKGKGLVFVIDELQTLEPEQAKPLRDLHMGLHNCPILVVGSGLQNTRAVLSQCGISRIADGIELGPLDRDATREVISETLAAFGRDAPPRVIDLLAEATHDFPQHIHCYITAARGAVKDAAGWCSADKLAAALKEGDRLRTKHYDNRLMAMGDGRPRMTPLIAHMVKTGARRMSKRAAEKVVSEAGNDDGKASVADAIQHGVLTLEGDARVGFGIPSFHNHMLGVLREHQRELQQEQPDRSGVGR